MMTMAMDSCRDLYAKVPDLTHKSFVSIDIMFIAAGLMGMPCSDAASVTIDEPLGKGIKENAKSHRYKRSIIEDVTNNLTDSISLAHKNGDSIKEKSLLMLSYSKENILSIDGMSDVLSNIINKSKKTISLISENNRVVGSIFSILSRADIHTLEISASAIVTGLIVSKLYDMATSKFGAEEIKKASDDIQNNETPQRSSFKM